MKGVLTYPFFFCKNKGKFNFNIVKVSICCIIVYENSCYGKVC